MNSHYICEVSIKYRNHIILLLKNHKISIYSIFYKEDKMQIEVDEDGYQNILNLKVPYKIKISAYKGKVKLLSFFRKYRLFLFSLTCGFILLMCLSNLIWKVEVIHAKEEIRTLLITALEDRGVTPFSWKLSFSKKEKIKEEILAEYKDQLEWLEIEEVGTKYVVRVEERKINKVIEDKTPRNVIASKDAMILSITALKGEIVKKRFDYVKKGDVLISGIIHKEEEAKSKVRADGEVYGEVWYTVSVLLPIVKEEEKIIGTPKRKMVIHFLGKTWGFNPQNTKIKDSYALLKSPLLPISLEYSLLENVVLITKHYNMITGEKEGIRLAQEKLKVKLNEKSEIISQKVLKKEKKGSKIYIEVFFKVKEDITTYESLQNIDLSKENKKEEG